MEFQRCQRCGREEHIPTHQFVKFDNRVQYLCKECWENFRTWFIKGAPFPQRNLHSIA